MTKEEAIKWLKGIQGCYKKKYFDLNLLNELCVEAIDLAIESLSADRVEVVRCGDCKFLMPSGLCTVFADECIRPSVSDFCSHGQRRKK